MKLSTIAVLVALLGLGQIGTATACPKVFGASSLKGSYIVTIDLNHRSNLTNGPSSPGAALGLLDFDGQGDVTGGSVTSTAGSTSGPVSGTYVVASNGTGTITVQAGPNPPFGTLPCTVDFVMYDGCGQGDDFLELSDFDIYWDHSALADQAGTSFSAPMLKGTYVVNESWLNRVVGIASLNSVKTATGTCCFFGRHGE